METSLSNEWLASQSRDESPYTGTKIGVYGWRKRLLYVIIILLTVMVIINLALTLWIVKVMDFSKDGMGKLRIQEHGLRMEGQAEFLHTVYANTIKSRPDHSLKIESARDLTLNARNQENVITTRLRLGDQKLQTVASKFEVKNPSGKTLFHAADDGVEVSSGNLKVTGEGGAVFQDSVRTPYIYSDFNSDLNIESLTRNVSVSSPRGIAMESRSGDIHVSCLSDIRLKSIRGSIFLDADKVFIDSLPEVAVSPLITNYRNFYQLCVCQNGKLFLQTSTGFCSANIETCK